MDNRRHHHLQAHLLNPAKDEQCVSLYTRALGETIIVPLQMITFSMSHFVEAMSPEILLSELLDKVKAEKSRVARLLLPNTGLVSSLSARALIAQEHWRKTVFCIDTIAEL